MIKAQIVAALKAMTHNLNYGERVSHILNASSVWSEFKDQKHDLFITDTNIRGYLTGKLNLFGIFACIQSRTKSCICSLPINLGVAPTAGYLTQGPSKTVEVLTSPPPIDRDDPLVRSTDDS